MRGILQRQLLLFVDFSIFDACVRQALLTTLTLEHDLLSKRQQLALLPPPPAGAQRSYKAQVLERETAMMEPSLAAAKGQWACSCS